MEPLMTAADDMRPNPLAGLDDALVRLRRLWSSPRQVIDHDGQPIEMSSILVVEACARGAARGAEVTVGDVAQFADVTPSTASRLVDRAVRAELLLRSPSRHDARRSVLQLTAAGRELQREALHARLGWLGSVVRDWRDQDLVSLVDLLGRFADCMAITGPPAHGQPPPPVPPPPRTHGESTTVQPTHREQA